MKITLLDKWKLAQAIIADEKLSANAARVAIAMLDFVNTKTGACYPSYATIASRAGTKRRNSAIDGSRELAKAGWLTIQKGPTRTSLNSFRFAFNAKPASAPDAPDTTSASADSGLAASAKSAPSASALGDRTSALSDRTSAPGAPEPIYSPGRTGGEEIIPPTPRAPDGAGEEFEGLAKLWQRPHGENYKQARRLYDTACREGASPGEILTSARQWVATQEPHFLPSLVNWFGRELWRADPPQPQGKKKASLVEGALRYGGHIE